MIRALFVSLCAVFAAYGALDDSAVANRKWVREYVAQLTGIETPATNVVVVTNANGTITRTSEYSNPEIPGARGISLTFAPVARQRVVMRAKPVEPSFFSFLFGTAYAETLPTWVTQITFHLYSGFWTRETDHGTVVTPFELGNGYTHTQDITLPYVESNTHTCDIDSSDCNCKLYGKEVTIPDSIKDWTAADMRAKGLLNWDTWIDTADLEPGSNGRYYLKDVDGYKHNMDNIAASDAFRDALYDIMKELNEYFAEERTKYESSHTCTKVNPQHSWGAWSTTEATPGNGGAPGNLHMERTCSRNNSHTDSKDEPCYHPNETATTEYTENSVIIKHTCNDCGGVRQEEDPNKDSCIPAINYHKPSANACGCMCGTYNASNPMMNEDYHKAAANSCLCQCGHWHNYTDDGDCEHVCGTCNTRKLTHTPTPADANDHTPCTREDGHCGCKCQQYTHTSEDARFHIQMANSCRCLGANGTGGRFHFPEGLSTCKNICQYAIDGVYHLANTGAQAVDAGTLTAAQVSDHTITTAARCGCECGAYDNLNYALWAGVNFHNPNLTSCQCYCTHANASACDHPNPLHNWGEWVETSKVSPGWIYWKHTCSRCGKDEDEPRACTHPNKTGKYETRNSVLCFVISCTKCGWEDVKPVDTDDDCDAESGFHVPADSGCGCKCGTYNAANPSTDAALHKFASGSCICQCTHYHAATVGECANVCGTCKTRKRTTTPTDAVEADHTPVESGRCGCKCNHYNNSNRASSGTFHLQGSGCLCYCSNGQNNGFHYYCPDPNCPGVCAHLINGRRHLVGTSSSGIISFGSGDYSNLGLPSWHTKNDGDYCGCKCRDFNQGNWNLWSSHNWHIVNPNTCGCKCTHATEQQLGDDYHRRSVGHCYCMCALRKHLWPEHKTGCPNICSLCDGRYADATQGEYTGDILFYHTIKDSGCGCVCGTFAGSDCTQARVGGSYKDWHHIVGNGCRCSCNLVHVGEADPNCPNICSKCSGSGTGNLVSTGDPASVSDHSFNANSCQCKCSRVTMPHEWGDKNDQTVSSGKCPDCEIIIETHQVTETCQRCGTASTPYTYVVNAHTHDPAHPDDPVTPGPCAGICDCIGCSCTACKYANGNCSTCGLLCGGNVNNEDNPDPLNNDGNTIVPENIK